MRNSRSFSFKCATHERDREIYSINDFHVINNKDEKPFVKKIAECIAIKMLPHHRDHKKYEIWRFLFYMLLHAGWFHLIFNLIVQVLIGAPLEMVHGSVRIACIYLSGVLAGSLSTSIFDTNAYLVGSSGGVYALLAAHLANIMLNYSNMEYGIYRLLAILLFASCDVGFAIYSRYESEPTATLPSVSFIAHIAGAVAGLTIGIIVLKNFEQKLHEQLLWWIALGLYSACIIFAVIYNIVNSGSNYNFMLDEKIPIT
ncbi:hypothetical protein PVAND_011827 [Polypedilum vanderplanki]|uniref:rhomboid protease n=1 Tax=Polypedilum vanderplanki TaxID=319348 RepID=A0A9J6CKG9_POLVA|nr:hypothetical protein PVAND_011827 [Polypedilum vanderplanki]